MNGRGETRDPSGGGLASARGGECKSNNRDRGTPSSYSRHEVFSSRSPCTSEDSHPSMLGQRHRNSGLLTFSFGIRDASAETTEFVSETRSAVEGWQVSLRLAGLLSTSPSILTPHTTTRISSPHVFTVLNLLLSSSLSHCRLRSWHQKRVDTEFEGRRSLRADASPSPAILCLPSSS